MRSWDEDHTTGAIFVALVVITFAFGSYCHHIDRAQTACMAAIEKGMDKVVEELCK